MSEQESPALVLDCRGERCPLPVIRLAREIGGVDVGAVIAVAADDPAAAADIPAWCRMQGQDYAGQRADPDGTPVFAIRRVR